MNYFSSLGSTLLYAVAIIYAACRFFYILPFGKKTNITLTAVYGAAAVCFLLSLTKLLNHLPMWLASAVYVFGNTWFIFMIYSLILFLAIRVLQLMRILPDKLLKRSIAGSIIVFGITVGVMAYGAMNYRNVHREEITITTAKVEKPLKIVMLSDMHLGYHNRRPTLKRWVEMINKEKPDLILIAGDVIDRNARVVNEDFDVLEFIQLKAPVYACLGNHEYRAGVDNSKAFYRKAGINLLIDSAATVCGITVIGRDDSTNELRLRPYQLANKTDPKTYRIILDHHPDTLSETCLAKVDFQFSGHTHGGQIWPVSLLVDLTHELAYGYKEINGTRFYVTSGLGIWGGRFRIGTRSEYVVLNLLPEGLQHAEPENPAQEQPATPAPVDTAALPHAGVQNTIPL